MQQAGSPVLKLVINESILFSSRTVFSAVNPFTLTYVTIGSSGQHKQIPPPHARAGGLNSKPFSHKWSCPCDLYVKGTRVRRFTLQQDGGHGAHRRAAHIRWSPRSGVRKKTSGFIKSLFSNMPRCVSVGGQNPCLNLNGGK